MERDEENLFDQARSAGKFFAKQAARQALKRARKAAAKGTGKLLAKGFAAVAGAVGWPALPLAAAGGLVAGPLVYRILKLLGSFFGFS